MSDFLARFDAALAALGLASEPWLMQGRKLRGTVGGRDVRGTFSVRTTRHGGGGPRTYAGHRLELEVSTTLDSRLVVFVPTGLRLLIARSNRWFGLHELRPAPPLSHLRAWTADADWASRLLADSEAASALQSLLPASGAAGGGLQHSPAKWTFSVLDHGERLLAAFPGVLAALCELAARAESLPAPEYPYEPSWPERHPRASRFALLVGCPAIVALIAVLATAALVTAYLLAAQGH